MKRKQEVQWTPAPPPEWNRSYTETKFVVCSQIPVDVDAPDYIPVDVDGYDQHMEESHIVAAEFDRKEDAFFWVQHQRAILNNETFYWVKEREIICRSRWVREDH